MSKVNDIGNIIDVIGINIKTSPYAISFQSNRIALGVNNVIITLDYVNEQKLFYIQSEYTIKCIKLIKKGRCLITVGINKKFLNVCLYDINNNDISCVIENKSEILTDSVGKIFFEFNNNLNEFFVFISNHSSQLCVYKGNYNNERSKMCIDFYALFNIKTQIKNVTMLFEYNWLFCIDPQHIQIIRLSSNANSNTTPSAIINKINAYNSPFSPKTFLLFTISSNNEYKNILYQKNYYMSILTKEGSCLIYNTDSQLIKNVIYDEIEIISQTYNENTLYFGTNDANIIAYDVNYLKEKYIIDLSLTNISQPIDKVYISENNDSVIAFLSDCTLIRGKVSNLLKEKPVISSSINYQILSMSHRYKIKSVTFSCYQSDSPQIPLYTCSDDGSIIKWFYRGDRWVNTLCLNAPNAKFTYIKLNPKFQNLIFVGDAFGSLFIFDLIKNDSTFELIHKFKFANYPIDTIAFNSNKIDIIAIGYNNGMIALYKFDLNKPCCAFIVKICEDFSNEYNIKLREDNNIVKSFCYFYSFEENKIIFLSNKNTITTSNINYINNNAVSLIDGEFSYRENIIILDIKVHNSDKYILLLLSNNQIDIRELKTIMTVGVINIDTILKPVNFSIDPSGMFLMVNNCNSRGSIILVIDINNGEEIDRSCNLMSAVYIFSSEDGRYIIMCGLDGCVNILNNFDCIRKSVFTFIEEERKKGIFSLWENFTIAFSDSNKQIIIPKTKSNTNEQTQKQIKTFNNNQNISKSTYSKPYQKEKFTQVNQSTHENISFNCNPLNTSNRNTMNFISTPLNTNDMSRRYESQNQSYNSIQEHKMFERNNAQLSKDKQFSNLGYSINNNNIKSLNKFQSIFPIFQMPTIEKVNKGYLKSKALSHVIQNQTIVEIPLKKEQDDIKYKNISNAINELLIKEKEKFPKAQTLVSLNNQTPKSFTPIRFNDQRDDSQIFQMQLPFQNDSLNYNNQFNFEEQANISQINNKSKDSIMSHSHYINNRFDNRIQKIFPEDTSIDQINNSLISLPNNQYNESYRQSVSQYHINNITNVNNGAYSYSNNQREYNEMSIMQMVSKDNSIEKDMEYISDKIKNFEQSNLQHLN